MTLEALQSWVPSQTECQLRSNGLSFVEIQMIFPELIKWLWDLTRYRLVVSKWRIGFVTLVLRCLAWLLLLASSHFGTYLFSFYLTLGDIYFLSIFLSVFFLFCKITYICQSYGHFCHASLDLKYVFCQQAWQVCRLWYCCTLGQ